MFSKLATTLFIGLAASAALDLSPREEGNGTLVCFGSCSAESSDTIVRYPFSRTDVTHTYPPNQALPLTDTHHQCLWKCPSGTVCGTGKDDCPVKLPEPVDPVPPVDLPEPVDPVPPVDLPEPVEPVPPVDLPEPVDPVPPVDLPEPVDPVPPVDLPEPVDPVPPVDLPEPESTEVST